MPDATIAVVGLGRIGLPTAVVAARSLGGVVGYDASPNRMKAIRAGAVGSEPGLRDALEDARIEGRLQLSDAIPAAHSVIIAIRERGDVPDAVVAAARLGAKLVLIETTLATDGFERIRSGLETAGFAVGTALSLAACPERAAPGSLLDEIVTSPRLVGGATARCTEHAVAFYEQFVQAEVHGTSAELAVLSKLVENAQRDVGIALVNELADLAEAAEVDPHELLRLANTHPRVQLLRPGIGVGGDCLPKARQALLELAADVGALAPLLRRAAEANEGSPRRRAAALLHRLDHGSDSVVAVYGRTYKPNVSDTARSPAVELVAELAALGVEVRWHDPHVTSEGLSSTLETCVDGASALVIAVAHREVAAIDPTALVARMRSAIVVDPSGALDRANWTRAGFFYIAR